MTLELRCIAAMSFQLNLRLFRRPSCVFLQATVIGVPTPFCCLHCNAEGGTDSCRSTATIFGMQIRVATKLMSIVGELFHAALCCGTELLRALRSEGISTADASWAPCRTTFVTHKCFSGVLFLAAGARLPTCVFRVTAAFLACCTAIRRSFVMESGDGAA